MADQTHELNEESNDSEFIGLNQDLEDPKPLDLTGDWDGTVLEVSQVTGKTGFQYYQVSVSIDTQRGNRRVRGCVFPGAPLRDFLSLAGVDPSTADGKLFKANVIGKPVRIRVQGQPAEDGVRVWWNIQEFLHR